MKGAQVEISDITSRYGDFVALHETNITIAAGEFFALLGPSGSGKSTLLGVLAGFTQPHSGSVLVNGVPITELPPYRRNIGMVFQNYSLFPFMTVAENIAFPLQTRGLRKTEIKNRVLRALESVRLSSMADRLPRQLSGGQQQRVALARASVYDPPLLLMDEPLGALDKNLREEMQDEIKEFHRKIGATIVYVTHDQQEAAAMASRMAIMNHGRLEQVGSPRELYDKPANSFVASFLGEANMLPIVSAASSGPGQWSLETKGGATIVSTFDPTLFTSFQACIRPQRMSIARVPGVGANQIAGQVVDAMFSTGSVRYRVRDAGGTTLLVRTTSDTGQSMYEVGDAVYVGWDASDTMLVPN